MTILGVACLTMASCSGADDNQRPTPAPTETAPSQQARAHDVIDSGLPGRGPELCEDGAAESIPPSCLGTPIVGWDWTKVPHSTASDPRTPDTVVHFGRYSVTNFERDEGKIIIDMNDVVEETKS